MVGFYRGLIIFQVNFLVFYRPPKPFNKDVVKYPPAAVHADTNVAVLQYAGELQTGKLAPLIGVEDLRLADAQSRFQGFHAKVGVKSASWRITSKPLSSFWGPLLAAWTDTSTAQYRWLQGLRMAPHNP